MVRKSQNAFSQLTKLVSIKHTGALLGGYSKRVAENGKHSGVVCKLCLQNNGSLASPGMPISEFYTCKAVFFNIVTEDCTSAGYWHFILVHMNWAFQE
jgi:hypothetical protein